MRAVPDVFDAVDLFPHLGEDDEDTAATTVGGQGRRSACRCRRRKDAASLAESEGVGREERKVSLRP